LNSFVISFTVYIVDEYCFSTLVLPGFRLAKSGGVGIAIRLWRRIRSVLMTLWFALCFACATVGAAATSWPCQTDPLSYLHLPTLFGETEAEGSCDDFPSARLPFSLCMFLGLYASREELEEKGIPTDCQRYVFRSLYIDDPTFR
jgi:hypothetical protein